MWEGSAAKEHKKSQRHAWPSGDRVRSSLPPAGLRALVGKSKTLVFCALEGKEQTTRMEKLKGTQRLVCHCGFVLGVKKGLGWSGARVMDVSS